MKKQPADPYYGFSPPRRRVTRLLLTAILLSFALICFVLVLGPLLFAMALASALVELSAALGVMAWISMLAFVVIPKLIELLWLLQTGQPVQFVMRLLQALSG